MSTLSPGEGPVHVDSLAALDDIVAADPVVLLELYTSGCTICGNMEPILSNVSRAAAATVVTMNAGDDLESVERFDVRSVPTLVLFEGGERVATLADGFVPTERLIEFVETRGESERPSE